MELRLASCSAGTAIRRTITYLLIASAWHAHAATEDFFVARSSANNIFASVNYETCGRSEINLGTGTTPSGVAVNPSGTRVYVANYSGGSVSVFDKRSGSRLATVTGIGEALDVAATDARVYVAGGRRLFVIDALTNTLVTSVMLNATASRVAVKPDGSRVYVAFGSNLGVVDASNNSMLWTTVINGVPTNIAALPDGTRAYIGNALNAEVTIVDLVARAVTGTIPTQGIPFAVGINPAGTRVFVANNDNANGLSRPGNLAVIDTATNGIIATRNIVENPYGVAVTSAHVYVSNSSSPGPVNGSMSVYDIASLSLLRTVDLGSIPAGVAVWEAPPPAPPPAGFQVTGIEVTQAIQDLAGSVRLVERKRAVARVYVERTSPAGAQPVTAYLYGLGQTCGTVECFNGAFGSIIPSNASGPAKIIPIIPTRAHLEDSFYFELPWDWTNVHTLTVYAVLATPGAPKPACNRDAPGRTVDFEVGTQLDVQFVNMEYPWNGSTQRVSPLENVLGRSAIQRLFPLSELVDRPTRTIYDSALTSRVSRDSDDCSDENDMSCAQRYLTEKYEMLRLYYGALGENYDLVQNAEGAYLMIPQVNPDATERYFTRGAWGRYGIGAGPAINASVVDGDAVKANFSFYTAHEIGHLLDRQHPAAASARCDHSADDSNYPYPDAGIHPLTSHSIGTGLLGFDVGDKLYRVPIGPIDAVEAYDLMSYCKPKWISDYTYDAMYLEMRARRPWIGRANMQSDARKVGTSQPHAKASTPQLGDWLIVAATLKQGASNPGRLRASRVDRVVHLPTRVPGTHSVRLIGAGGLTLADYPLTTEFDSGSPVGTGAELRVATVVPYTVGTREVQVVELASNRVAATRAVSANAPVVSNVTAGVLDTATHVLTLTWTASDPDQDVLTYDIIVTRDGGSTWVPLTVGASSTSINVDLSTVGGGSAMFRVVASDGLLTAHADSAPVAVPNKAPQISILSPADGESPFAGQVLNLEGFATDVQDGPLPEARLVWSIPGRTLGTGRRLTVTDLPQGTNAITLTGTNSAGLTTSQTIELSVRAVPSIPARFMHVAPMQLGWQVAPGDTALLSRTLSIGSNGTGTVQFAAQSSESWLTLSVNSGVAPTTITLTANPNGLPARTRRTAIVRVTESGVPGEPIDIPVSLSVGDTFNTPVAATPLTPPVPLPASNAGADQTVNEAATVNLNGAASTVAPGHTATYRWTQTQGTSVTLNDASMQNPTFVAPHPNGASEALRFELAVTDDTEQRATDEVLITVNALPTTPSSPPQVSEKKGGGTFEWLTLLMLVAVWLARCLECSAPAWSKSRWVE